MNTQSSSVQPKVLATPNGAGAAAILAAGIGSFLVALFAILADKIAAIRSLMNFYKPTGPLSGVTTCAIVAWLAAWIVLYLRWHRQNISARSNTVALILLIIGLLLTFPPIAACFKCAPRGFGSVYARMQKRRSWHVGQPRRLGCRLQLASRRKRLR